MIDLDDRIRDLVHAVGSAAPEPLPFPGDSRPGADDLSLERVAVVRPLAPPSRRPRVLVLVAAVAVLAVGIGAAIVRTNGRSGVKTTAPPLAPGVSTTVSPSTSSSTPADDAALPQGLPDPRNRYFAPSYVPAGFFVGSAYATALNTSVAEPGRSLMVATTDGKRRRSLTVAIGELPLGSTSLRSDRTVHGRPAQYDDRFVVWTEKGLTLALDSEDDRMSALDLAEQVAVGARAEEVALPVGARDQVWIDSDKQNPWAVSLMFERENLSRPKNDEIALSVSAGNERGLEILGGEQMEDRTISGHAARLGRTVDGGRAIVWSPSTGVVMYLGSDALSEAELIAVANSIAETDFKGFKVAAPSLRIDPVSNNGTPIYRVGEWAAVVVDGEIFRFLPTAEGEAQTCLYLNSQYGSGGRCGTPFQLEVDGAHDIWIGIASADVTSVTATVDDVEVATVPTFPLPGQVRRFFAVKTDFGSKDAYQLRLIAHEGSARSYDITPSPYLSMKVDSVFRRGRNGGRSVQPVPPAVRGSAIVSGTFEGRPWTVYESRGPTCLEFEYAQSESRGCQPAPVAGFRKLVLLGDRHRFIAAELDDRGVELRVTFADGSKAVATPQSGLVVVGIDVDRGVRLVEALDASGNVVGSLAVNVPGDAKANYEFGNVSESDGTMSVEEPAK
jgi:hypothetical protein